VTLKFETKLQRILRRDGIRSDSASPNEPELEGVMRWLSGRTLTSADKSFIASAWLNSGATAASIVPVSGVEAAYMRNKSRKPLYRKSSSAAGPGSHEDRGPEPPQLAALADDRFLACSFLNRTRCGMGV